MTTPDAAFLDEVEDFLVSFDLPIFPTLQTLADLDNSDDSAPSEAVPAPKARGSSSGRKRSKQAIDPVVKHELEKAKDRKRRSLYRERRRVEKETLKEQVGELSTELAELQKAKEGDRSLASSAWEMVAKRQLQARVDSEEKQRRLLRAIESQSGLIQGFQNIIHDIGEKVDDVAYKHKRIRLEPSDAEFYKAYVLELDDFYAQTDEALKRYGLDSIDASWDQPRRQWKEEGETGYYIYTDKNIMPFDYELVYKQTWRVAQMHHRQQDREGYDIGDPDNTAAFKFRVTHRLQSGRTVSALQRAVVRRYLEDERSVVVWRSFCEGEGIFQGMHADESGWCISVPLPNAPEPSTLTRTMMRQVPMHFSSKATQEPDVNQFVGFVLGTGSEDALEISSRLEKLVLQGK
ncbi:hypothetical protein P3T76_002214 [Phytophthora citrophthora]|uniref:BZIP domain-containing protein n=1 Tax=Phytophthora citrophthora TaxID=4793 RepID=A0AAD9GXP8_9STRA|nr:hypothetical protein P3T76_002214 [Phytophthora citrophthora]